MQLGVYMKLSNAEFLMRVVASKAGVKPLVPYTNNRAKQAYDATINREKQLRALGYKVISIWEADWKKSPAHVVKTVKTKVERLIRV